MRSRQRDRQMIRRDPVVRINTANSSHIDIMKRIDAHRTGMSIHMTLDRHIRNVLND